MNILLIDDEPLTLQMLQKKIPWQEIGIDQVYTANDTRFARQLLQTFSIQLLVCDIEMPGENGLDLVEWAMEYARFSKDPMICIMLTCHPEYSFLRKAMQLGCQDYLLKPVDEEDLEASLKKAVEALNLRSKAYRQEPEKEPESGRDIIRQKVLPYIHQNLTEPFTVSELAQNVSLNPQYMMRLFKKETNMSVLEYVTDRFRFVRYGVAVILMFTGLKMLAVLVLSTDSSIENIAVQLGYYNYTYFMKVFKRNMGMSPGQYRKQYGK